MCFHNLYIISYNLPSSFCVELLLARGLAMPEILFNEIAFSCVHTCMSHFVTSSLLWTSGIIFIDSNACTIGNGIGHVGLFMSLVKKVRHWSLGVDCHIISPMTATCCSWSYHSPKSFLQAFILYSPAPVSLLPP